MTPWSPPTTTRHAAWCPICHSRITPGQSIRTRIENGTLTAAHTQCIDRLRNTELRTQR